LLPLVILGLVTIIATMLEYWSQRWRTFVPLSAFHDGPADDYELAMLTDGDKLVVLVALLNLESRGTLKLARGGSRLPWPGVGTGGGAAPTPSIVASIGFLEPPADPVETAVYRAVLAGHDSEKGICADSGVALALDDVRHSLVANGLLLDLWPVPPELAEHPWFQDLNPRTLLGHELVRRLRKAHPVELERPLAHFGTRMLTKVDADLARTRARGVPRQRWSGILAWSDFTGDGGDLDMGGSW